QSASTNIFSNKEIDFSIQLWMAARFLEGLSFFVAPFFLDKKIRARLVFAIFASFSLLFVLMIFRWENFPHIFMPTGNTSLFYKYGEYIIIVLFFLGTIFLYRRKKFFEKRVLGFLIAALVLRIIAEVILSVLSTHNGNHNIWNFLGLQLKIVAYYVAYLGIIGIEMMSPHKFIVEELKRRGEKLRESEERYRFLVESSPDAIVLHNKGLIMYANPAAARLFGFVDKNDLLGKYIQDFIHSDYKEKVKGRIGRLYDKSIAVAPTFELQIVRNDGIFIDAEVSGRLVNYAGKDLIQSMIRDVTEKKKSQDRIKFLSSHDSLTGVYNRYYFDDKIKKLLFHNNISIGLIIVDIDGLKIINDNYGHVSGDSLIQRTARVLLDACSDKCVISRIGGDEFGVIVPDTNMEEMELVVEHIRKRLDEEENDYDLECNKLSFSTGFSIYEPDGDFSKTFKEADNMMYVDKMNRRKTGKSNIA
ncbi:MAG TPA: hypothetical protein DEA27_04200, partial [Candidatus Moranbacteria bacterium]|nr:hypothetical protein [Candidatus Moranbacteria bacterium]